MKKKIPALTATLFVVAAILLAGSSIGGARAALNYYSENYSSQLTLNTLSVSLNENGTAVAQSGAAGTLLNRDLESDGGVVPGKAYPETLTVTNTGDIDAYVRVVLYKYWLDENGNKVTDLDPDLIELELTGNGWVVDSAASTAERTVLYYTAPLAPGATTPSLTDTLTISSQITSAVTKVPNGDGGYTLVYQYDGVTFQLEAEAYGVQTHNAEDAILSAWGREVTVSGDTLSLR